MSFSFFFVFLLDFVFSFFLGGLETQIFIGKIALKTMKLAKICILNIGTHGCSISIWQDPWLSLKKHERPMEPPTEHSADLCVSDLMISGSPQWDRAKIQLLLPDYEEKILCLQPSITGVPDKLFWLGTKSGNYSSKSSYYIAIENEMNLNNQEATFNWKKECLEPRLCPEG